MRFPSALHDGNCAPTSVSLRAGNSDAAGSASEMLGASPLNGTGTTYRSFEICASAWSPTGAIFTTAAGAPASPPGAGSGNRAPVTLRCVRGSLPSHRMDTRPSPWLYMKMRVVSFVKCGPLLPNAPAMNVALPPAAGTHTSSACPAKPPDSRTVCAGLRIEGIPGGELDRLSARRRNLIETAAVARPLDERDPLPIRRPRRLRVVARQVADLSRRTARIVHHVQLVHRDERELLLVRGRDRVTDLPNGEFRCVVDLVVERELRPDANLRLHVERDVRRAAGRIGSSPLCGRTRSLCRRARHWNAPDLAAVGDDNRLRV